MSVDNAIAIKNISNNQREFKHIEQQKFRVSNKKNHFISVLQKKIVETGRAKMVINPIRLSNTILPKRCENFVVHADVNEKNAHHDYHLSNEFSEIPTIQQSVPAEKFIKENADVIVKAKIASNKDDEINLLIKKLTLSFTAKKNESQFLIAHGNFKAVRFHIISNEKNISLTIHNASVQAKDLIFSHRENLKNRLQQQEINLTGIRFIA